MGARDLDEAQRGEARAGLPQAGPEPRDEGARPRMRLGRVRWSSRRDATASRSRLHRVPRAGGARGTELCRGLPVELRLADYRARAREYDAVVSIGLMEHVGPKNHRVYMETVDRCLAPGRRCVRPHHREQPAQVLIDAWFHKLRLPERRHSLARARSVRRWMGVRPRGRAQHRSSTTTRPDGLGPELRARLADLRARYGERFRRNLAVLPALLGGSVPRPVHAAVPIVMTRPGTPQPECRRS